MGLEEAAGGLVAMDTPSACEAKTLFCRWRGVRSWCCLLVSSRVKMRKTLKKAWEKDEIIGTRAGKC